VVSGQSLLPDVIEESRSLGSLELAAGRWAVGRGMSIDSKS